MNGDKMQGVARVPSEPTIRQHISELYGLKNDLDHLTAECAQVIGEVGTLLFRAIKTEADKVPCRDDQKEPSFDSDACTEEQLLVLHGQMVSLRNRLANVCGNLKLIYARI